MKKFLRAMIILSVILGAGAASAEQGKGLNVTVTSADRQTQMMAMVLSVQTMKKHGKEVNLVLCGPAGDLALKSTKTEAFKPSGKSPTMLLNALLKSGASVEICPLYLPNSGQTDAALIEGINIAKPPMVAGRLLDTGYRSLTF
jgi:hypothetical protein